MKILNIIKRSFPIKRSRGVGYNEYLIVLSLISVFSVAALQNYGQVIQHQSAGVAMEISGGQTNASRTRHPQPPSSATESSKQNSDYLQAQATAPTVIQRILNKLD